jgi:signal transduction histidine kinase/ligand-binding sensor domain-containing protein/DNA-binding response OmpR family regulator
MNAIREIRLLSSKGRTKLKKLLSLSIIENYSLLILLFLILPCNSLAQINLDFDELSIEDGFSSSRANVILQDRKGYMWIGTWNGLNRYDGNHCVVYQPSINDTLSISNREVTAMIEARDGSLWVGTTQGLNKYDPVHNHFKRFQFEKRITSLVEDFDRNIWVGTMGDGLFILNPSTGKRKHFFKDEYIYEVYEDSKNNIWLATDYGIVNFDRLTESHKVYNVDNRSLKDKMGTAYRTIVEASNGELWVGMWSGGICKLIPDENKDSIEIQAYSPSAGNGRLSGYSVDHLRFDNDGNLWIGTGGGGLFMLSEEEQHEKTNQAYFVLFEHDWNDKHSFKGDNYISALFIDRSQMLWVGSSSINKTKIGDRIIDRYNTREIIDGDVHNNWIRSITGNSHQLWTGTNEGLILFDLTEHPLHRDISYYYHYKGVTRNMPQVIALYEDDNGLIWAGTNRDGLLIIDPRDGIVNGVVEPCFMFNNKTTPGFPDNHITSFAESSLPGNSAWVGTIGNGVMECKFHDGVLDTKKIGKPGSAVLSEPIRTLYEDKNGVLWIGTHYGLNSYNPKTGEMFHYFHNPQDKSTINDNVINVLFEDSNGSLWVGTNFGLNRVKKNKENTLDDVRFENFSSEPWINSSIVINILEDDKKNLWVGVYDGIIKVRLADGKVDFEFFDKAYSRVKIDINAAMKDSSGNFFFGGGTGLLTFHPDSIKSKIDAPHAEITDLQLYNPDAFITDISYSDDSPYSAISYSDSITFKYDVGGFTFVVSPMEYYSTSTFKYAYMLEGYENTWNYAGNRNTATYTNIPHGNYMFRVKTCNSYGVWSEESREVVVTILPPFWKTRWAYIIYMFFGVAVMYLLNRFSILKVKEKARTSLEKIEYEKEIELNELKVHFFTNITHEFRTPLTLIYSPLQEMLAHRETFGIYTRNLELIHRNTNRLLRLIDQLMEFRKVEKGKVELLQQEVDLIPIMNEICDSFKSLSDSKKIDFNFQYEQPSIHVWIDLDKFDKVIFNILSNAFKFTDEGGKVKVKCKLEEGKSINHIKIEIEDTGIGIPEDKLSEIFERFYQTNQRGAQSIGGIGLYLSKNFVELHDGNITVESVLDIGTIFKISIPQYIGNSSTGPKNRIKSVDINEENQRIKNDSEEMIESIYDEKQTGNRSRAYVLLVEDDLDMNDFISSSLNPHFKVKIAYNGKAGIEAAKRFMPDVIVTDIMMPEMDGIEMVKQLQQDVNTSHIPIIFLTAKTTRENEQEGLQSGAVDYVYKPFSMSSLKLKIFNILKNRDTMHLSFQRSHVLEPKVEELTSLDEKFLSDVMSVFEKNIDNSDFDVEKLSSELGLSSNQTYRKIKALTGQTAKEFIRTQRLKIASKLLSQKKRTVSEIIYMVGFSNPSYFSRCFKDFYGCTPSEYISTISDKESEDNKQQ